MTIEVTQDDIDSGIARQCRDCPIALAVERAANVPRRSVVASQYEIKIGGQYFKVPKSALDFINAFDAEMSVKPFTFELTERIL